MTNENNSNSILVPAPTAWPFIAALGITLIASGLVTHAAVSAVGAVLLLRAAIGWWSARPTGTGRGGRDLGPMI